jgi:hypothetical protein
MSRKILFTAGLLFVASTIFCQPKSKNQEETQLLADHVFFLSEIMLHDVTNPPAASRNYAYAMLGAYEVAYFGNHQLPNINTSLKGTPGFNSPTVPKEFSLSFCSNYTILEVGRQLIPSGALLEEKQKKLIQLFKKKLSKEKIEQQVQFSTEVAKQIVQYARADSYNKLSTYPRYTPSKKEGHWYPTPPEYMSAVEPQWKTVRPFLLDSANQFAPLPPVSFSKEKNSAFHKQMTEVYEIVKNITPEQKEIANFWDCNPFAVTYSGHMAIGLKKISPGGHWMGITGIVCKKSGVRLDSAILIHATVALTLHDAFISCWQEKYSSDRIRPEAAINKLLDPTWRPILQTPPFPEYTSGHSVASASVATVLTHFLSDHFSFIDTSEKYFGLPERHFKSFNQAAQEAAVSRLYGGIHFRDACEEGASQGKKVGQFILKSLFNASLKN